MKKLITRLAISSNFSLANAQITIGKHRLILQVQDDKQRLAESELRIEVE